MFIDLNMPEMDGIELCREIKKLAPMTVLYAITGYASIFQLAECREAGFEDFFKKPVNIATLRQNAASAFEKVERWRKY
jgi:CheY-like chemotaxis protein